MSSSSGLRIFYADDAKVKKIESSSFTEVKDVEKADVYVGKQGKTYADRGRIVLELSNDSAEDCADWNDKHRLSGVRHINADTMNFTDTLEGAVLDYDNVHTFRNLMYELTAALERVHTTSITTLMGKLGVAPPASIVVADAYVDTVSIDNNITLAEGFATGGKNDDANTMVRVKYYPRKLDKEQWDVLEDSLKIPLIVAISREGSGRDLERMKAIRQYQLSHPQAMLALVMYDYNKKEVTLAQHRSILADGVDQLNMQSHTGLMSSASPDTDWFSEMQRLFGELGITAPAFYNAVLTADSATKR
jgi:hypothetical protein